MKKINILIIEDDPLMLAEIEHVFSGQADYLLWSESTGAEAITRLEALRQQDVIVILDLGLPDVDGSEVARRFSHSPTIGIIVVTGRIDHDVKLNLLEIGADAYITKPFDPRELLLTVQAVRRRVFPTLDEARENNWKFVPRDWLLIAPNGVNVKLTAVETQLLDLLLRNKGKPVSRLRIGEALGDLYRYSGNSLEATVSRFRKKVNAAYPNAVIIKAASGCGYMVPPDIL